MTSPHAAATIRCVRCGAPIQFDGVAARVRCSYCATDQQVPEALRQSLRRYEANVAHQVNAANASYQEANAWQQVADQHAPARSGGAAFMALASIVPLVIVGGFYAVVQIGIVPQVYMGLIGPVVFVAFGIVIALRHATNKQSAAKRVQAGPLRV